MTTTHSHVDLCTFVQVLEIPLESIPPEWLPTLNEGSDRDIAELLTPDDQGNGARFFIDEKTQLHESLHIVQAVHYPFLHWYGTLLFMQVMRSLPTVAMFEQMKIADPSGAFAVPAFHILEREHTILDTSWRILGFQLTDTIDLARTGALQASDKRQILFQFSLIDMIENAASVMQYQFQSGDDQPDQKRYSRWCKRNPSYSSLLEAFGAFIGNHHVALRCFPDLIQSCFETSQPQLAFAILTGAVKRKLANGALDGLLAQTTPIRWLEVFDVYLKSRLQEEEDIGNILTPYFFKLDRISVGGISVGGLLHPTIGAYVRKWSGLAGLDLAYRYAFTAPNGYSKQIHEISELFTTPVSILKFITDKRNRVVVTGDLSRSGLAASNTHFTDAQQQAAFIEFLLIFGIVRRASSALMAEEFRLCHHKACPHYEANACNAWVRVPENYADCEFPERYEALLREAAKRGPNKDADIRMIAGTVGPELLRELRK